ncbi:N-acetylmuramoyl-L-alanine amidase [Parapedobacter tibetensis]|uniref:N-acetylmuramoyl-L-alanine amidase n=1 Tax=Parapedobacter tibetensis TaxID=2972951 RepID=UPI00214D34E1|nr:N-acetylmuramoyl-L-alanine amidase [Parapedobacter tibetensis]
MKLSVSPLPLGSNYYRGNTPKSLFFAVFMAVTMVLSSSFVSMGQQHPRLKIVSPAADSSMIDTSIAYFRGVADPSGMLFLNGTEVKIYRTGVFAAPLYLQNGINELEICHVVDTDTLRKRMVMVHEKPAPPQPTAGFAIEYARILPGGELWLQPGDHLQVEMKATPGMQAYFYKDIPLYEVDASEAGVAGIYRGEYTVQPSDTLANKRIPFYLRDNATKKNVTLDSREQVTFLTQHHTLTGLTTGDQAPLFYGLGTDRLGGARMGHLDNGVKLEVTGKWQDMYRVRLSEQMQAYIPANNLRLQKGVHFRPHSITGSWAVYTDTVNDYVAIGLNERLPYTSIQQQDPTRIVVDVYGAVSNSNWITQKDGLLAIQNVWYEQVSKDIFRIYIELKEKQLWGYEIGYEGSRLVIRVKPQPPVLDLRQLTVAVDAGHGGSNRGAMGMTGVLEKDLNLSMALKLKKALDRAGASVIMTRETDKPFNNGERLKWIKQQNPDILVSIHCNASGNPMVQGASTYYRHQPYRPVSQHIYAEMRKLGLADFGNVGGFNFTLNSPTEFPSVLVEVAFLSNPEDEERLLDTKFHDEVAGSIVAGLQRFLREVDQLSAVSYRKSAIGN